MTRSGSQRALTARFSRLPGSSSPPWAIGARSASSERTEPSCARPSNESPDVGPAVPARQSTARGRDRAAHDLNGERTPRDPDVSVLEWPRAGQPSALGAVQQSWGSQLVRRPLIELPKSRHDQPIIQKPPEAEFV